MAYISKIKMVVPVAGIFILQSLLPVVMLAVLFSIKAGQKKFIGDNYDNESLFQHIRFVVGDKDARFIGEGELLYKGVMYDIHSIKIVEQEYIVTALQDKEETNIYCLGAGKCGYMLDTELTHLSPVPFYLLYYEQQDELAHIFSRWVAAAFEELKVQPVHTVAIKIPKPPPRYTT